MTYKNLLLTALVAFLFGMSSCGSNDDDDTNNGIAAICENYSDDILDLGEGIGTALQAYSTNPTTATCTAYVDALDAYINGLNDFFDSSCIPVAQLGTYQETVDEFNASKQDILDSCADL